MVVDVEAEEVAVDLAVLGGLAASEAAASEGVASEAVDLVAALAVDVLNDRLSRLLIHQSLIQLLIFLRNTGTASTGWAARHSSMGLPSSGSIPCSICWWKSPCNYECLSWVQR